ncbi:MAG TPA: ATP-binding cassette domain-containing protein [Clostridiaceae bacterium]|nr:ATP-binding cassette domain-containing protein [Clostridiaceae bacterium]
MNPLLEVKQLKVHFPVRLKSQFRPAYVRAVDGIDFTIYKGETFGLVGESGCGKTTTGKAIVKLVEPSAGRIFYDGKDIARPMKRAERKELARNVQFIFQDPFSSLDPRLTVGKIVEEPLIIHGLGDAEERRKTVAKLLTDVGLSADRAQSFPHEFSGGQRQRIGVARALALNPSLIVCDEPVSALDVSVQAQILNLMKTLQDSYNLSYLFISHNLAVVKHLCDRIAVMYLGKIVELAGKQSLFEKPSHPYAEALLAAIPLPDPEALMHDEPLEGDMPSPIKPPPGCPFHTRCKYAFARCRIDEPQLLPLDGDADHLVACHLCHPDTGTIHKIKK